MKEKFFLAVILIFSFIIRVWDLNKNPAGFFCDEASIGYNAYSILSNGQDEYGAHWPIFFKAFGEYKSPIQIYATVPLIALFGLNEFSVRLASVVFGTLGVLGIWLLTSELFKNHKRRWPIAFLAAFFLATSPWHIHSSRIAFELMPYVFFTTMALFLFIRAINLKSNLYFYLAVVVFAITTYTYFPARLFIPLFLLGMMIIFAKRISSKNIAVGIVIFILLSLPMANHIMGGGGVARFQQISIFSQTNIATKEKARHIVEAYFNHLSPMFLFQKGDIDFPGQTVTRHSVRGIGELYWWQSGLIILGLLYLLRHLKSSKEELAVLLLWLILYPTGSAFTIDLHPQATRSIIGVVPFQIVSAMGLVYLIGLIKKTFLRKIIIAVTAVIIIISFQNYFQKYFIEYPQYSSDFWGWQSGPREIVSFFKENQKSYDDLIMTGSFNAPGIFFKFYASNDCGKCQIGGLDKINPQRRQLFALKPEEIKISKNDMILKKEIFYPNQDLAFVIFEVKQ